MINIFFYKINNNQKKLWLIDLLDFIFIIHQKI